MTRMISGVWIFGAGETGRLFGRYIRALPDYYIAGYVIEDSYMKPNEVYGKAVIPYSTWLKKHEQDQYVIVAITGRLDNKERIYNQLVKNNCKLFTYIDPTVFIDRDVKVGDGCFIFENNVIQSGVTIGNNTILWSGNHIGHQTTIGNSCFVSSHVVFCGGVKVHDRCFFGVNSAIAPAITIESDSFIGMGVNITRNVREGEKIKGVDTRDVNTDEHCTLWPKVYGDVE